MKHHGRITIKKDQVMHYVKQGGCGHRCMYCGQTALHIVKIREDVSPMYVCTKHFTQIFRVPPNRHPKKVKVREKQVVSKTRDFILKRNLEFPLRFRGERLLCHSLMNGLIYLSLYRHEHKDEFPDAYVMSLTYIYPKSPFSAFTEAAKKTKAHRPALHFVISPAGATAYDFELTAKKLLVYFEDKVVKVSNDKMSLEGRMNLESGVTEFLTECALTINWQ